MCAMYPLLDHVCNCQQIFWKLMFKNTESNLFNMAWKEAWFSANGVIGGKRDSRMGFYKCYFALVFIGGSDTKLQDFDVIINTKTVLIILSSE